MIELWWNASQRITSVAYTRYHSTPKMCSGRGRERGSALVSCTYYEMIASNLPLLKFLQNLENIFPVSSGKTRPAPDKLSSKQFVKDHTHTKKLKTKIIELGIWSRNMCHLWRHPVSGTLSNTISAPVWGFVFSFCRNS